MLRRFRKPLVALAACLGLLASSVPAEAYNPSAREDQRPRVGASTWGPRKVDFNSFYDTFTGNNVFVFGFDWYQTEHMLDLEGSEQVFEIQAKVDCAWALYSGQNTGYIPGWWDTNIPGAAFPYEGTMFNPPNACQDGKIPVEVGVMNAAALVHGQHYYIRVGTTPSPAGARPQSSVSLKAQTGFTYDTELPLLPMDDADCEFNSSEIAAWNNTSQGSQDVRMQASWCANIDWTHTVVKDVSAVTGVNYWPGFNTDYLANQGLEETTCSGDGCYYFSFGNNRVLLLLVREQRSPILQRLDARLRWGLFRPVQ